MKYLLTSLIMLAVILFTTTNAAALDCPNPSPCQGLSFYSLQVYGCPEYQGKEVDLSVPLCRQPSTFAFSYLDKRCYKEIPFDWEKPCFELDCNVPYEHKFVEPVSGCTFSEPMDADEVDQHYRSVRQKLGQVLRIKKRK